MILTVAALLFVLFLGYFLGWREKGRAAYRRGESAGYQEGINHGYRCGAADAIHAVNRIMRRRDLPMIEVDGCSCAECQRAERNNVN
jgi:hypothetical protein